MKANHFIIVGVTLSVLMSAASLAWQAKSFGEPPTFSELLNKPLQISQLDYLNFRAQFDMLRDIVQYRNGIGSPNIINFVSRDFKTLGIFVPVLPKELPSNYDERTKLFSQFANFYIADAKSNIGIWDDDAFEVHFYDPEKRSREKVKDPIFDPLSFPVVASFKNGKLIVR